jgi:hypothetical protein
MIVDEIRHSEEICQLPRDLPKFLVISAVKQVLPRDAPTRAHPDVVGGF